MIAPVNAPIPSKSTTTRHDGWTHDRRRIFLERVAEGHTVEAACAHVGMSKVTAYALRRRDSDFALAWGAAVLEARDAVAETLTSHALAGQVETLTRADGATFTRHRFDNRLGLALLARLDRLAAQPGVSAFDRPDQAALRAAAHALDTLVDLVGQGDLDAGAVAAFIEPHLGKLRKLCRGDGISGREEQTEETRDHDAAERDDPVGTAPKQPQMRELRKLRTAEPAPDDAGSAAKQPHPREVRKLGTRRHAVIPDLTPQRPASSDRFEFVEKHLIHAETRRRGELDAIPSRLRAFA